MTESWLVRSYVSILFSLSISQSPFSIPHSLFATRYSLLAMFHREADTNNGNVIELGFCAAKEMDFP